ncbi:hypothetical protein HMPREF1492_0541 [Atopobium sp. BS2]|nr:hypothetical protein HMPREF1492_0541 [Atopobium sp. BS2]
MKCIDTYTILHFGLKHIAPIRQSIACLEGNTSTTQLRLLIFFIKTFTEIVCRYS